MNQHWSRPRNWWRRAGYVDSLGRSVLIRRSVLFVAYVALMFALACTAPSSIDSRLGEWIRVLMAPAFMWLYVRFARGRPVTGIAFIAAVTFILPMTFLFVIFEFNKPRLSSAVSHFLSVFVQIPKSINVFWFLPTVAAAIVVPVVRRQTLTDAPNPTVRKDH